MIPNSFLSPFSSNLRKAQSNIEVAQSQDNIDLDDETIEEVRQNKQQIKAMFEAAAPKYRYGGSNECLIKDEEKSKKGIEFYDSEIHFRLV